MAKRRDRRAEDPPTVPNYRADRKQPSAAVPIWRCPNCGQRYFGAHPPDLCDYCQDFTTWQPADPPADSGV